MARTAAWIALLSLALVTPVTRAETVLRIGTSGDYAPFTLRGHGFDVDVAQAMARDFGVRIEWVTFRWPELRSRIAADGFDVAMSGITWRPERAVIGWMTRAVARGGPCVVGNPSGGLVAVNRGGVLESWAHRQLATQALVPIDDNLSLPALLEGGAVSAFVTDSFEVASRPRPPAAAVACEPPRDRKVYWVAPARAADLGPRIDAWLSAHESTLDELRRRWFGGSAPLDEADDVIDLVARRLALMPAVAAWKRTHEQAVENREREQAVLARAGEAARAAGLDVESVRHLFAVQIELAKSIERRSTDGGVALDLDRELRPALSQIGDRIVASLAAGLPLDGSALSDDRLAPLGELLSRGEVARLRAALLEVGRAKR